MEGILRKIEPVMKRRPQPPRSNPRYEDDYQDRRPPANKPSFASALNAVTIAVLVAVFVLGIGVGVGFSSATSAPVGSLATRYDLDKVAPSSDLCVQFGASAVTMEMRAFVTLNPIAVYVSQPRTQPGCVLRSSNFSVLEQRKLVTPQQVSQCRQRLNTFGFTGDIDKPGVEPKIDCIYQNDAAQNLFLDQPGINPIPREAERF